LRYEALHRAAFTFLVAREHPLASRGTVTVADIAAAGLITAPLDQVEWAHYADVLHEVGLGPPTWHWKWTVCKRGYWPPKQVSAC